MGTFRILLRESTPKAALGLRLALLLVTLSPLWLWGRLTTFSGLAQGRRTELLRELLGHRSFIVRELTTLLKFCAAMALLGDPAVRARSGFDNVQATTEVESGVRTRLPVIGEGAAEPVAVWPGSDGAADEVELPREAG